MKLIWKSIKLVIFCKLLKMMMGIGLMVFSVFMFKGYSDYKDALEKKPLAQAMEEITQKPSYVSLEQVPDIYKQALIAVEDHRFYDHMGVDVIATGRAIVNDIKAMDFVEGGSTITQQLAKNMYFTQEKTLERKAAEMLMALKIEREYSKEEILEAYINSIYYGEGYYSLREASLGYFGKEPWDMTDDECTLLVGVPNAPAVYAPSVDMEMARKRQQQVLSMMQQNEVLAEVN
ncbi:transglycosylase domain-containing protein [Frisingicoccus sp.]|uniref:transglycosylase domain-containing protein n=1 Tax=Frisingicoccus sp. TaxID=1918627 RepID=UPI003AB709C1